MGLSTGQLIHRAMPVIMCGMQTMTGPLHYLFLDRIALALQEILRPSCALIIAAFCTGTGG